MGDRDPNGDSGSVKAFRYDVLLEDAADRARRYIAELEARLGLAEAELSTFTDT